MGTCDGFCYGVEAQEILIGWGPIRILNFPWSWGGGWGGPGARIGVENGFASLLSFEFAYSPSKHSRQLGLRSVVWVNAFRLRFSCIDWLLPRLADSSCCFSNHSDANHSSYANRFFSHPMLYPGQIYGFYFHQLDKWHSDPMVLGRFMCV